MSATEDTALKGDLLSASSYSHGPQEQECVVGLTGCREDLYGMTMCSMVRDFYVIHQGLGSVHVRVARVLSTFLLLFSCVLLQSLLLYKIQQLVAAGSIHDIRIVYHKFESTVYKPPYDVTVNGYNRGRNKSSRDKSAFRKMKDEDKDLICAIPLSQPYYTGSILLIWTICCAAELRGTLLTGNLIARGIETCSDIATCVETKEGPHGKMVVKGLPGWYKGVMVAVLIIPRFLITFILLYMGCRWLLATTSFSDILLNSVALEFIMLLKDSLYIALVSTRSKDDLERTFIRPKTSTIVPRLRDYVGTFVWALLAIAWVLSFMGWRDRFNGFQNVLPQYKWDVWDVCMPYNDYRYCITPPCPKKPVWK